jgi:hypothetical protein
VRDGLSRMIAGVFKPTFQMLHASLALLEADATISFCPPMKEIAVMLSWWASTDQLTSSFDSSLPNDLTLKVPFLSADSKSLSFGLTLINSGASSRFLFRFLSGESGLSDSSILGAIVTFWTPKSADETKI